MSEGWLSECFLLENGRVAQWPENIVANSQISIERRKEINFYSNWLAEEVLLLRRVILTSYLPGW